jgi:hypothetical protein
MNALIINKKNMEGLETRKIVVQEGTETRQEKSEAAERFVYEMFKQKLSQIPNILNENPNFLDSSERRF